MNEFSNVSSDPNIRNSGLGISQRGIQNNFWCGRKISFGVKCFVAALGVALIVASVVCPPFAAISVIFCLSHWHVTLSLAAVKILHATVLVAGVTMAASTLLPLPDLVRKLCFKVKYNVPFTGSTDTKKNALENAFIKLYASGSVRGAEKEKVLRNWRNVNSIPGVLFGWYELRKKKF